MGCTASGAQVVHPTAVQNGSMAFEAAVKPKISGVPFTEREVFTLSKSWKNISKHMVSAGIRMFLRMFEQRNEVKVMFEQFRTVEKVEELYSSSSMENHALIVMNALDEAMTNLDDEEYLMEFLITTGKSHQRFENFSTSVFWAIEEPFMIAVKETMGDKFTTQLEKLYHRAIKFFLTTLIHGYAQRDRDETISVTGSLKE